MRTLKPIGCLIDFDGKERHFLFTINVIDQIQDHYDMHIDEVMNMLLGKEPEERRKSYSNLKYIVTTLVNEDVEIHNEESEEKWKPVTENYIGRHISMDNIGIVTLTVIQAYTASLPAKESEDEEEDPNQRSEQ
jgi:hypothetical protein